MEPQNVNREAAPVEQPKPVPAAVVAPTSAAGHAAAAPAEPAGSGGGWKVLLALILIAGIVGGAIYLRHGEKERSEKPVVAGPVTVAAAKVTRENVYNELVIPGEFRPYVEVELHAKVSGYVDKINVDFGDHVKAGQLLATLEVPELRDQIRNAQAMQQKAETDYTNAHTLYTRLLKVNESHPNLVAQQDLDNAQAKDASSTAAIAAARADVEKYETMVKYTQIIAPFDGVVTKRYADPGSLIQAATSSDTGAKPVVRVSDNYRLRMDFPVSVKYVKDIHVDQEVSVKVESLDGRIITGKVTRFTQRVNEDTRTMMAEIEVPNPKLEIVPGMYAEVLLKVGQRTDVLVVPTQAVGGGSDSTVFVINQDHQIEVRKVTFGVETPEKFEVISGLNENDLVMIGNRSFVVPGQKVDVKLVTQPTPSAK